MSENVPSAGETEPETPHAKRLSMPEFPLPENPSREELFEAVSNALLSIAENLRWLRRAADRDTHQSEANAAKIREHADEIADLKGRVERLEGLVEGV